MRVNLYKSLYFLLIFIALVFLSCSYNKTNVSVISCLEKITHEDCFITKFDQLLDSASKYESKCIQIEGYLSLKFEDIAIYKSNKSRERMHSEKGYWLNFNDSLISCIESNELLLNKRKVIIKGFFTSTRKGHLNAYSGEIDDVYHIQVINN
jgi:hypothetical protein